MPQIPFEIPKSLSSYAEHFDEDPAKAISRLEKQLKKRGPDAVGHFLLSWFYHLKDQNSQAIEEAVKAKIYAPGSPFCEKLHYYLSHPKTLDAWTPNVSPSSSQPSYLNEHSPVLNLDSLIEKLSGIESQYIEPDERDSKGNAEQKVVSDDVDNIVSETLASIHEKQGKTEAAIQTYRKLKDLNQEKSDHYDDQISRLEKEREEEQKEKQG